MDTQPVYCPRCGREVQVTTTPSPVHHGGQAVIPDSRVICLGYSEACEGAPGEALDDSLEGSLPRCPVFGLPTLIMGIERARAGLTPQPRPMARAVCSGCGFETEHEKVSASYGVCQTCGTTNRL